VGLRVLDGGRRGTAESCDRRQLETGFHEPEVRSPAPQQDIGTDLFEVDAGVQSGFPRERALARWWCVVAVLRVGSLSGRCDNRTTRPRQRARCSQGRRRRRKTMDTSLGAVWPRGIYDLFKPTAIPPIPSPQHITVSPTRPRRVARGAVLSANR